MNYANNAMHVAIYLNMLLSKSIGEIMNNTTYY